MADLSLTTDFDKQQLLVANYIITSKEAIADDDDQSPKQTFDCRISRRYAKQIMRLTRYLKRHKSSLVRKFDIFV